MPDNVLGQWVWSNNERSVLTFRKNVMAWGKLYIRSFPWRQTHNPYHILVAEVMLHRTQVGQVVPIYKEFIDKFPNLPRLAKAKPDELETVLRPLGLYWRIDMIYRMGQILTEKFGMQVPAEKADLLSLPGVSDYIASAVRCFAWNLPEALIDTNTVRIIGRVFGWQIKDSSRRNPHYRQTLATLVDTNDPRSYNYALLDLAHLICLKKKTPLCDQCPLFDTCRFGQSTNIA